MTTSSGAIAERYAYTAYGQPTITSASGTVLTSSAVGNRYTYTGREWDETLGLHHFRARWMSPLAGRFLTRDPIRYLGSKWCLYCFVENRSLDGVDPFGTQGFKSWKIICDEAFDEFMKDHQAEFDKRCGKDKYSYPWGLRKTCELNSSRGACWKNNQKKLGYMSCHDKSFKGDAVEMVVCVDNVKGNPTDEERKASYKQTIAHEFVHALDSCSCNNNCKELTYIENDDDSRKNSCRYMACTELRAYSYVDCRNEPAANFEKCVKDGAKASMSLTACASETHLVDDLFDTCVIKQRQPITFPPPVP